MKAIVLLKITSGEANKVNNTLKEQKTVLECCAPFGRYDAAAIIQAESLEDIWQIITSRIRKTSGVIETFPCLLEDDKSLENLPDFMQEFVTTIH